MMDAMPKTVIVDVKMLLPKQLQKDLKEDEMLCPVCHGLGLVKHTQQYRLMGVTHPSGNCFPFKYEVMGICNSCYNGIVAKCKYCGQPNRNKTNIRAEHTCQCEQARNAHAVDEARKDWLKWDKAGKVDFDEAVQLFEMVYIDNYDKYVSTDEIGEYLYDLGEDADDEMEPRTLRIYGTTTTEISFDAHSLIGDACGDLHDEAEDHISDEQRAELQLLLNKWCEGVSQGTKTYYPDWSVGVLPPVAEHE